MTITTSRRALVKGGAMLTGALAAGGARGAATHVIASPDGQVEVTLFEEGPAWQVRYRSKVVIERSPLALVLGDGALLGPDARAGGSSRRAVTGSWTPPYGIRTSSTEACNEVTLTLRDARRGITFALVARAYDGGAALRLRLDEAPKNMLELSGEAVEIRLPADAVLRCSRDEGNYQVVPQTAIDPVPHPPLTGSSDHGPLADVPLTVQLASGVAMVISESDRLHYPRTMFQSTPHGIITRLMRYPGRATGWSGPGDTPEETSFAMAAGASAPWRVVVIAPDAKGLLERQDLIPTLGSPNRLGDVSWIKPGRAMRIRDYVTQAGLDTVDFAAKRKLDYVMWDAHWYGDGTDPSDATCAIPAIDIHKVIAYAQSKGLGMILYVDRVPAMRQLDAIVKTYQAWGVAGIKFGFMWEGRQSDTDFITKLVRVCGEHGLFVSLHDNLRPAGLERTYPNYIALEGVRGNENFPTATHNCTLPFARAMAGPIDYTICFGNIKNHTTNAHQLAMAAVYYNPLTLLYWYDSPAKYAGRDWPELAFFDECPTTWEATVALSGRIGEHVVVARRSKGRWFLGAMTNEQGRRLTIPLHFLGQGAWTARRFADGAPGNVPVDTPVVLSHHAVDAGQSLTLDLAPAGGQAIIFERA